MGKKKIELKTETGTVSNEVECVTKKFKGKFPAGYDEITEYVVKQCANV